MDALELVVQMLHRAERLDVVPARTAVPIETARHEMRAAVLLQQIAVTHACRPADPAQ